MVFESHGQPPGDISGSHADAMIERSVDMAQVCREQVEAPPGQERAARTEREIDSSALFEGARLVAIRHGAERYTLRITRAGKLILTK